MDGSTKLRNPALAGWARTADGAGPCGSGHSVALRKAEYFWKNPIADARFRTITDFDVVSEAAAISPDGNLVAFLSDRDGPMDVWVTQVGSGEYHNLTHGSFPGLVNPSIRTLAFSPDASLVTFWLRRSSGSGGENIGTSWAVPVLGGSPRPYLDGVAEFGRSRDRSELAFHTSASGDPLYVAKDGRLSDAKLIFTAASGLSLSLSAVVPRGRFPLSRPQLHPRQARHLAHPFGRRNTRTRHLPQRHCDVSGCS